jgi:hypothetical protein
MESQNNAQNDKIEIVARSVSLFVDGKDGKEKCKIQFTPLASA